MDTTIAAAPLDVEAITARADAASPGEWYVNDENDGEGPAPHWVVANEAWVDGNYLPEGSATLHTDEWLSKADAEFIAHARTDIPALLAALAAERDRADRAEAQVAYALSVLGTASIPLGVTELFFKDSLIREARRALSSPEATA